MSSNPSWFSRPGGGQDKVKNLPDADLAHFPVESVSWEDCQEFLASLNAREKTDGGWTYRLPTEAEWEYSCRGGPVFKEDCACHFYFTAPTNDLSSREANFDGRHPAGKGKKGPYLARPTRVGSYRPNRLGLYDMHGNVWEWTSSQEGSSRVIRGGGWNYDAAGCAAAYRIGLVPGHRDGRLGFRLLAVPSVSASQSGA
jgi:formylglycine-generating enzyme required for sulfatase activity